jgi:hypothetical protein
MFVLCSKINIGGKDFKGVHEVRIERSIYKPGATATVKVPVTAVRQQSGLPPAQIETAKAVKAGDPVRIELGYDGVYHLEFAGYVKQLNLKTPLEIECEDAFYLTRKKSVTLSGKTTLAAVLKKCGLNVAYCATLNLQQFQADKKPVSWVLGKLKKDYGLVIFFDTDGRVYAAEPFKVTGDTVKYSLRENVINDDNLKYQLAEDVKLKIKAICIYRNGTKVEATVGASDGTEKTVYFYDVENQKELTALAAAELKRYSYDGYSGKIETFLFPFAAPAMLAEMRDAVYNERDGRYYVESVTTSYGTSGARRTVEIGLKI